MGWGRCLYEDDGRLRGYNLGEVSWGPFRFLHVVRPASGYEGWETSCPHHPEIVLRKGKSCTRRCRKAKKIKDGAREAMLSRLKEWCLRGRHCQVRSDHLHVKFPTKPKPAAELDAELARALAEPNWLLPPAEGGKEGVAASSSSDSSTSSSSSNSSSN